MDRTDHDGWAYVRLFDLFTEALQKAGAALRSSVLSRFSVFCDSVALMQFWSREHAR